jgi:hypothetical protein
MWTWLKWILVIVAIGASALAIFIVWTVPGVPDGLDDSQQATLRNEYRKTYTQIVAGLVLLIGVFFTWKRVGAAERAAAAAERTVAVAEEGQITERFTRAIEHLGNEDNEAIILGGIYALERIARDSQRDHWQVMEVLTAYVRSKALWSNLYGIAVDTTIPIRPTAPVQAILDVLGRRRTDYETDRQRLDLHETDLRGASFLRANFSEANFLGANMERAELMGVDLKGANLRTVAGLKAEQIKFAIIDDFTILPEDLLHLLQ